MVPGLHSPGTQQAAAIIPYENFKGAVLGNHYQLQYQVQDGHLRHYVVTSLRPSKRRLSSGQNPVPISGDDEVLEAKAFPLSCPCIHGQESHARRRRIKRICRSENFRDEVEQHGMRFLISHVQRSVAEWKNLYRPAIPPAKPVEDPSHDVPAGTSKRDSFSDFSSMKSSLDSDVPFSDTESMSGYSSVTDPYSRPSSRASTIFSSATSVSSPPSSPTPSWARIAALSSAASHIRSAVTTQQHQKDIEIVVSHDHTQPRGRHHDQHHDQFYHQSQQFQHMAIGPPPPSYAQALADGLPKRTSTAKGLRQVRNRQRWREERRIQVTHGHPIAR